MRMLVLTTVALALACGGIVARTSAFAGQSGFNVDRSAMSDAYWQIWNSEEQKKINLVGTHPSKPM